MAISLLSIGCGNKETAPKQGEAKGGAPAPTPTAAGPIVIDPSTKVDPKGLKPGLKLTTFPNNTFSGPGEAESIAPVIGFDCDRNPYAGKEASLRYTGWLKVDQDGPYCLQFVADDQVSLSLNGKLILDQFAGAKDSQVVLKAGFYEVRFDYQNNVGDACLAVKWALRDCAAATPIEAKSFFH